MTVRIACAVALAAALLAAPGCSKSGVKGTSSQSDVDGPGLDGDDDAADSGPQGTDADGPDGGGPDGVVPDGVVPDGVEPDGVEPDGVDPDGTGPDTEVVTPGTCIVDACDVGNCAEVPTCAAALSCLEACETTGCGEGCLEAAPEAVQEALGGVIVCGVFAGCLVEGDAPGSACCEAHDTGGCGDADCEATVCGLDDYCCAIEWDEICAGVAVESCESCEGPGPQCGDGSCDEGESCGTCPDDCGECAASDCCEPHDAVGCEDAECQAMVCAEDHFCCNASWDEACAELAFEICGACEGGGPTCGDGVCGDTEGCAGCPEDCGPCGGGGDCCEVHSEPGCDDDACVGEVCGEDPFCCEAEWDEVCAAHAHEVCAVCDGVEPVCGDGVCGDTEGCAGCPEDCGPCGGGGDCCEAHAEPGCDDDACVAMICGEDPFCCQAEWDDVCAGQAGAACAVCDGGGPVCGDGTCDAGEDCPQDCGGGGAVLECLVEQCGASACLASDACAQTLFCVFECADQDCAIGCIQGAPGGVQQQVIGVLQCGGDSGCFDGVGPQCGDGQCSGGESCEGCPEDCGPCGGGSCCEPSAGPGCELPLCQAAVCQQDGYCCEVEWDGICAEQAAGLCPACGGTGGPVCGDSECEPGEVCLEDCEQPALECLIDSCGAQQCLSNAPCLAGLQCLSGCETQACAQACIQGVPGVVQQTLIGLLECGADAGCFEGGGPVCGDGVCEPGESCDADCAVEPLECLVDKCEANQCLNNALCAGGLECLFGCDTEACAMGCIQGLPAFVQQTLIGIVECGVDVGCFEGGGGPVCGDGICEPAEDCAACPGDCGPCGGGSCCEPHDSVGCDDPGCEAQICGSDPFCCDTQWDAVCSGAATEQCAACGGGGPVCGDGICEPGETCNVDCGGGPVCGDGICEPGETCNVDCGGGPGCVVDSCQTGNCADFALCAAALGCISSCGTEACANACLATAPQPVADFLVGVIACGADAGCFEPTPGGCGDTLCGPGESCGSCPEDCGACPGGSCCEVGSGPGCDDAECSATVCAVDPFCCNQSWDGLCAGEAQDMCEVCGGGGPVCGDGVCEPGEVCDADCGVTPGCLADSCDFGGCDSFPACSAALACIQGCSSETCATGCLQGLGPNASQFLMGVIACGVGAGCFEPGGPVCGDGQCSPDESCGTCPADCGACPVGSCCEGGNEPGCADPACEAVVCAQDPFCCDSAWDGICADLAAKLCPDCGGGGPICGDGVCEPDEICDADCDPGGPICGDGVCEPGEICDLDCGPDPGCGDGVCSSVESCGSCPVDCGACPGGSCCEGGTAPGCDDPACVAVICAQDPFCCDNSWDGICASAASDQCEVCGGGGPVCGDGLCEPGEVCAADCNVMPICGDGICHTGEVCPVDCDVPGSCLADSCNLGACPDFPFCAAALACMEACTTSVCAQACLAGQGPEIQQFLGGVLQCGVQAGCYGPVVEPGCGDGQCDPALGEDCTSCPGDCGGCGTGDCCSAGGSLGCADPDCEALVCAADPFCCDTQWDEICASAAQDSCAVCDPGGGCGDGVCDDSEDCGLCPSDCGGCAGDCCSANGSPGCGSVECMNSVCAIADACCLGDWTDDCAALAADVCAVCEAGPECGNGQCEAGETQDSCPIDCGGGGNPFCGDGECNGFETCAQCEQDCGSCAGDCCEANGSPGCQDTPCQQVVCSEDLDCCYSGWDGLCAELAAVVCDACGGGLCGNGVCEAGEDANICPVDCGGVAPCGDGQCAADESCASCPADCGDCTGDCCTDNGGDSPGCADPSCQATICEADAFCCQVTWDVICASAADAQCDGCGGPTCGDGVCEQGEDCPADCSQSTGECLQDSCGFGNCQNFPLCSAALECIIGCSDADCAAACIPNIPAAGFLQNLVGCGEESGCFGAGTGPSCGDGECAGPEDCWTCTEDCGACGGDCCSANDSIGCEDADCQAQVCEADPYCCETAWDDGCADQASECQVCPADIFDNPLLQCVDDACGLDGCVANAGCLAALDCVSQCDGFTCLLGCLQAAPPTVQGTLLQLYQCGQAAGCL